VRAPLGEERRSEREPGEDKEKRGGTGAAGRRLLRLLLAAGRRAEPTGSTQEQQARALHPHPVRSSCCSTIWPCASCRGKLQGGVFVLPAHTITPFHLRDWLDVANPL